MWTRSQGPNPSITKNAADVGTAQNTNLLHSREEVCTASIVDTGIAQQFIVPYTLSNLVPSIHATLGAHVSQTHKNKIINGEYIDLTLLLENTTISEKQEKQIVIINGVLSTRDKTKKIVNTISKWTDAFIVYISIYSSAHPSKYQALLKYMHTVRLGATRVRGLAWEIYDEQFRLKRSMDLTTCWDAVDQELWLLYMVGGYNNEFQSSSTVFNNYRPSFNKSYNFNLKGICERNPCNYKHVCFKCSGNHPFSLCTLGMGQGNSVTQLLHPRTPNVQSFGFQHNFRHRVPRQNSTRFHGQGAPRYMGPR